MSRHESSAAFASKSFPRPAFLAESAISFRGSGPRDPRTLLGAFTHEVFDGMKTIDLDVVATRGAEVESRHRVHAAIVGADDTLVAAAREADIVSSWRSCA